MSIPVVAIGGINESNVREVMDCGVAAVAMISALNCAPNVTAATRAMIKLLLPFS
jgi:thiamine-phosphate pyrophosphorylase